MFITPHLFFADRTIERPFYFIGDMLQTLSADRPELSLGVGGDRRSFSIKQATLSELQPEYDAGNLSAPCGDKVGVKLPSRVPQDVEAGQGSRLESCASLATLLHIPSRQCALKYRCGHVAPPALRTRSGAQAAYAVGNPVRGLRNTTFSSITMAKVYEVWCPHHRLLTPRSAGMVLMNDC